MQIFTPAPGPKECGSCRFFVSIIAEDGYDRIGECRIARPVTRGSTREAIWPQTNTEDFCGEHQRRYIAEADPLCPAAAQSAA